MAALVAILIMVLILAGWLVSLWLMPRKRETDEHAEEGRFGP